MIEFRSLAAACREIQGSPSSLLKVSAGVLLLSACCSAQGITVTPDEGDSTTRNQLIVAGRPAPKRPTSATPAGAHPEVVVFTGDSVFAQLVDGGSWKTAFYFVNLESHATQFQVLFFNDDGTDMHLPLVGLGTSISVTVTLNPSGMVEFESLGNAANLAQGWAYIVQKGSYVGDSVGSNAVFRQSVPGFQPQEAVVPVVNQYESHFVLVYDNTSYTTAIAIVNPTANAVVIPVFIRNALGAIVQSQTLSLSAFHHVAFATAGQWSPTASAIGTIEFLTSGFGVGALGLRFNGQAFTSFSVLENINWVINP